MAKDLKHIGTPRHSGRYPWGSGNEPYQGSKDFRGQVLELKKSGMSEVEIAKGYGISVEKLRNRLTAAKAETRAADVGMAKKLLEKGYSKTEIGRRMGINESSVRSLLDPSIKERGEVLLTVSKALKDNVERKGLIDVGSGIETQLGISRTKLNAAVSLLEDEGYVVVSDIKFRQMGGKYTYMKVLAPPGTERDYIVKNKTNIKSITDYSEDGGRTILGLEPIRNIDSNRVLIRYAEDGGKLKDGVIELRRGVPELDLGSKRYAQVRIGVDGTHYLKGMAIYAYDDLPKGIDIVYNTNKGKSIPKEKVFKQNENDPDNPFGSIVRQKHYIDSSGKKQLSALNKVNEEGDWETWSRNLSSQMLSKQGPKLAAKQLELAYALKKEEFDEIMSLTNPAVKQVLLKDFSDGCDSDAVHLKAAALPRQANQVILPITSLNEHHVYAPKFRDGERVVLVRHPHGGTFEIPELIVKNSNPEAKSVLGRALDAIGINPKVAERLSGADFDGDTVIVIPDPHRQIKTSAPLKGLKDFDPRESYRIPDEAKGIRVMTKESKGLHMGMVSNLITDMTIKGAPPSEIALAVRHSMVVIDSEKHKLDYEQSFRDHNIAYLMKTYQGKESGGASTVISRASSTKYIDHVREGIKIVDPITGKSKRVFIDPKTGKKLYEKTGETYIKQVPDKKGPFHVDPQTGKKVYENTVPKVVKRLTKTTRMEFEADASALSSGTTIEGIYVNHANSLKALGNKARLAMINTPNLVYSKSASQTYSTEVRSLKAKLRLAFANKPNERQAQLLANQQVNAKYRERRLTKEEAKKIKTQVLEEARARFNAKKPAIKITDREWEAIQAGAISHHALISILRNTDPKTLKERATPRYSRGMSPARIMRARSLAALGHTQAEIADALGVSTSTLSKVLTEE